MKVIITVALVVGIVVTLYLVAWLYQWFVLNKLVLSDLRYLLDTLLSPQAVAFYGFISLYLIDKDKDGTPDASEQKLDGGIK